MRTILLMLLSLVSSICSASAADAYQIELSVSRDGVVISKPIAVVEAGKQADLSIGSDRDPNSAVRILATVTHSTAGKAGSETAKVDMQLLEQFQGEWILRSEPSITTYVGQAATVTVSNKDLKRPAPEFEIMVTVTKAAAAVVGSTGGCQGNGASRKLISLGEGSSATCGSARGTGLLAALGISDANASNTTP